MGTAIVVTSGKGGTGKTSITGGVAGSLARQGHSVLCIDMDAGLRNLDITLGILETLMPQVRLEEDGDGVYGIECSMPV